MSDTTFLKLSGGSRLTNYLGLRMDEGREHKFGKGYLFLEIPVRGIHRDEIETPAVLVDSPMIVKRNQHVFVEPACTLSVRGYNIVGIEPNPALSEFGQVQAGYKISPETGVQCPGFYYTARKDTDLSKLDYAIRIYMYA